MLGLGTCLHRSVAKDGRIVCAKIVEGDDEVSPNLCRSCPFKACNCRNLRFTLRKRVPRPIMVRYGNGRCEVWDDEPVSVCFVRAACAAKVAPIVGPKDCASCSLRQTVILDDGLREEKEASGGYRRRRGEGKVVLFPAPTLVAS